MKRDRMGRTREDTGEDTGTLSGWRGIAGRVSRFWGGKRIKYAVFCFVCWFLENTCLHLTSVKERL